MTDRKSDERKGNDDRKSDEREVNGDRKSDERKGNGDRKIDERKINGDRKSDERKSCESEKAEVPDDEALENLMMEQMRNQVRSDYRRSLGNENRRRYLE